jgi:hypothetical protein
MCFIHFIHLINFIHFIFYSFIPSCFPSLIHSFIHSPIHSLNFLRSFFLFHFYFHSYIYIYSCTIFVHSIHSFEHSLTASCSCVDHLRRGVPLLDTDPLSVIPQIPAPSLAFGSTCDKKDTQTQIPCGYLYIYTYIYTHVCGPICTDGFML